MGSDPFAGDTERLRNERASFRRRVGHWRIFFDVHLAQRLVAISYIERRTSTTYRQR